MKEKLIKLGLTEELADKLINNFGDIVDGKYVTKERFNEINNELKRANETIKERDVQLENLKNDEESTEALKIKITELEKTNKEVAKKAKEDLVAERKSNAVKLELMGKVHNANITMSQLKMENIIMDDDGKIVSGLKEQLEGLKKTDSYLFIPEKNEDQSTQNPEVQPFVKGATPKDGEAIPTANLSKAEQFAKTLAQTNLSSVKKSAESIYFGE